MTIYQHNVHYSPVGAVFLCHLPKIYCSLLKHSALNYNCLSLKMCTEPVSEQVFSFVTLSFVAGTCTNHKLRHSGKSIFHTHRYHYIKPLSYFELPAVFKKVNILLGTQIMLIVAHSVSLVKIFLALAENIN